MPLRSIVIAGLLARAASAGAAASAPATRPIEILTPDSRDADAVSSSAELSLDLATAEIEACCGGVLEEADWDAQRRWAEPLYRWIVLSDGPPDWSRLGRKERFSAQLLRLDPGYVAALAVHSRSFIDRYWDRLPRAAPLRPVTIGLDPFAQAVRVLGVFEQELQGQFDQRAEQVRAADQQYQELAGETLADLAQARKLLGASGAGVVDLERVFAQRRDEITAAIDRRQKQIRKLQEAFWTYQHDWSRENSDLEYGTVPFYREMAAYQSTAKTYTKRIDVLSHEIAELERKRERYRSGPSKKDLERIERPPVVRPVLDGTRPGPG